LIRNEENGLVVKPENPQALADGICELLAHPEKAEHFAATARQDITADYDAKHLADKWCDAYETEMRN
jgi:glycosyltransferase involved in cell wall biosynthesis